MKVGAEQVDDLVVVVGLDRLLEGDEIRPQASEAVDEQRPPVGPRTRPSPQVEGGNSHAVQARQAPNRYRRIGHAGIITWLGPAKLGTTPVA